MTENSLSQVLATAWNALAAQKLPAAIVGGLALAFWKHPRSTRDIDLLIIASGQQVKGLIQALEPVGFHLRNEHSIRLGQTDLFQFKYTPEGESLEIHLDLLVANGDFTKKAVARSVVIPGTNPALRVLCCEDLILMKLLSGRIIDLADATRLLELNDFNRVQLERQAAELGLQVELTRLFRAADDPALGENGDRSSY